jgi:D-glycero-alpha-D-manno-heptose 1-phosphate guanylyltransferase
MNSSGQEPKAVLLVGGLGTRLRSVVPSAPKPMAPVGDRPFLELLVHQLRSQEIRRLVMCTGYRAEEIEAEFGDGKVLEMAIEYSREPHPLGTAGALKFAQPMLQEASDFLVMNGDSFMEINFSELIQFHRLSGGIATMAAVRMKNESRYGTVVADAAGRVTGFAEKTGGGQAALVNAGIYVFNGAIFGHIPDGTASLEKDVFPQILNCGVYALEHQGVFIDIGTPEDYARAQGICERLYEAAGRKQAGRPQTD